MKKYISTLLLSLAALTGCATSSTQTSAGIDLMKHQLAEIKNTKRLEKTHLENFDDLDFNVYSSQKWDQFYKSQQTLLRRQPSENWIQDGVSWQ